MGEISILPLPEEKQFNRERDLTAEGTENTEESMV
jgi:hypothetical protein